MAFCDWLLFSVGLGTLADNQLTTSVLSILLLDLSILVPVPYWLDSCCFAVVPKLGSLSLPTILDSCFLGLF